MSCIYINVRSQVLRVRLANLILWVRIGAVAHAVESTEVVVVSVMSVDGVLLWTQGTSQVRELGVPAVASKFPAIKITMSFLRYAFKFCTDIHLAVMLHCSTS